MTQTGPTLSALAADLADQRTTSRALVEECLDQINDPKGEGARAFIGQANTSALEVADAMDQLRRAGAAPGPYAGIPITIKDLFDVASEVTTAGSVALSHAPPALSDAVSVARLRGAGFVFIGRSNMTEFAYSGLGLNPHYGTPLSVYDRASGHAPGGSSSGGAVAVADGMAHAALGTDTGGSCRIPAAFNGLAGWKPTARRVPIQGASPLSATLDSVGPIARSAACCAVLDALLAAEPWDGPDTNGVGGRRLLAPSTIVLDDLDPYVAAAFDAAIERLGAAGAQIVHAPFPELAELLALAAGGGIVAAESFANHRALLAASASSYDPRVASRMMVGESISAADYIDLLTRRRGLINRARQRLGSFDAMIMPTVAITPPQMAELEGDDGYWTVNARVLRNTMLTNLMDGCAISLPMTAPGERPAGLMLAALDGQDRRLLRLATAVEAVLG